MGLINPLKPQDGNNATAGSVNTPFDAIIAEINGNLDAANIKPNSLPWSVMASIEGQIPLSALEEGANINTFREDGQLQFVISGMKWNTVSGLTAAMSSGSVYNAIGMYQVFPTISGRTFTASKDTYVSIDDDDNMVYQEVSNDAGAPTLGADHMWIAIVKTGASTITSIVDIARRRITTGPVGHVTHFAGSVAPDGYFLCDGRAISRTVYADLFAVIGTTWGEGDGSTTFNVPNIKGRGIVTLDASQSEFDTLGETGGSKTQSLTTSQLPAHNHGASGLSTNSTGSHGHSISDPGHSHQLMANGAYGVAFASNGPKFPDSGGFGGYTHGSGTGISINSAGAHSHTISGNTANAGSGGAHNNLAPYAVMNSIIKW